MGSSVMTCMKAIFLIFNFVFWVTGLALLVVGILTKFWFGYMMKLSTDIDYDLAPYITIGCGVFIVLVGFVGCWGALKEHGWALKLYMFVLAVLFVGEIVGVVTGYLMRNKMNNGLKTGIKNAVKNYDKKTDAKDAMDQVQKNIKCCGVTTYKDYFNKTTTKESVPKSCCKNSDGTNCAYKDLRGKSINETGIYTKGCYDTVLADAKKNIVIIGGIALGIVVFQLLGVASAFILIRKFDESTNESESPYMRI